MTMYGIGRSHDYDTEVSGRHVGDSSNGYYGAPATGHWPTEHSPFGQEEQKENGRAKNDAWPVFEPQHVTPQQPHPYQATREAKQLQRHSLGSWFSSRNLDDIEPHNKRTGSDWYAIFSPQVKPVLDFDLLHTLTHESIVCCVRFSRDGKYLATGCNRQAHIFEVATGTKMYTLEDRQVKDVEENNYIRNVSFSPDGRCLATAAEDGIIRVSTVPCPLLAIWLIYGTALGYSVQQNPPTVARPRR